MDFLSGIGSAIILSSTCWIVFGKDRDKSKGIDGVKEGVREPLVGAEVQIRIAWVTDVRCVARRGGSIACAQIDWTRREYCA